MPAKSSVTAKDSLSSAKPQLGPNAPRRQFLGWDGPILRRTVALLLEKHSRHFDSTVPSSAVPRSSSAVPRSAVPGQAGDSQAGASRRDPSPDAPSPDASTKGTWDLRDLMVVLPSSLARRRLTELLAIKAEEEALVLYPPQIVTVGALPERLYVAKFPFASQLVQHLAWMRVLQATPPTQLTHLVPVPPPKSQVIQWLELSKVLASIHRELASDRLNFGDIAQHLGSGHPEYDRWTTLQNLQSEYHHVLDKQSLWDIQTARLFALNNQEAKADKEILVVGCVDLNLAQRGFLEAVRDRVEVWVAAPETESEKFDAYGCLATEQWQEATVEIPDDDLLVGNGPVDQAELTAGCLSQFGEQFHVRDVTIGVPDGTLISELKHRLALSDLPARYGPGSPLNQTEPVLLLALIGKFIEGRSFGAFAALLRHPAVENLIRVEKVAVPENWLSVVDAYYQDALPRRIDEFVNTGSRHSDCFQAVKACVEDWLSPLTKLTETSTTLGIADFVQPLLAVLSAAYDRLNCNLENADEGPLYSAAKSLCATILELRNIPADMQPLVSPAELIDWLIGNLQGVLIPETPNPECVELLGWLELALDDSPALIVTGMHDGVVPESINSDAFLPNKLRKQLGMMDNDRRYARDMYSMQVILHARDAVRFVVGKTEASGDPLVPSRLLMACELERLPARVMHLVQERQVDVLPKVPTRWEKNRSSTGLQIPLPDKSRVPEQISVTAFRSYLACPYRYYLGHVLGLRAQDDALEELGASQFGNLIHDTLAELKGPIAQSANKDEVAEFLIGHLRDIAAKTFGLNPATAVLIQLEQAEMRLEAFAEKQAQRASEGWVVKHVEAPIDRKDKVLIGIDKQVPLVGRIDRIDYHPDGDQWAIWDYKTSENAKNPISAHWSKAKGWIDLQLPLYRHLGKKFGTGKHPTLGYIAIPKLAAECGFRIAEFAPEQLEEADRLAHDIASRIANADYWPDELEDVRYDDFARICQANTQRVTISPPLSTPSRADESKAKVAKKTARDAAKLLELRPTSSPEMPPLLIRASAGTGKTFQLSNRLLQIILSGQDVDHILATTFTRKAAGEILNRVLERLATACVETRIQKELATFLPDVDASAANCLASLRRVTASIHRLRISTLDSFFAQVARTFSFEMSLPHGWSAMDPLQEPQFQMRAITRMLDSHDRKTLLDLVRMLSKGASSRQVAEEIRSTVSAGYSAFRITNEKHWDQLKVPAAPSENAIESALRAIEATKFGNKSADAQLEKLHLQARTGDWESVANHGIYKNLEQDPPTYYRKEIPADLIVALEVLTDAVKAHLLPLQRNQTLASYRVLSAFDAEYSAMVRQYRTLAFADVTHCLSQWMGGQTPADPKGSSPGESAVTRKRLEFRLDCGINHLLLDEFQDTAPDQWRILEPLAKPLAAAPGSEHSLFCVGDTKQAIYGWRGGVAEVFDSVTTSIPDTQQSVLSDSYRSSPEVIEAVNDVFLNLQRHENYSGCESVAKSWVKAFPRHRTAKTEQLGYVLLKNAPAVDADWSRDEKQQALLGHSVEQIAELTDRTSASVGVLMRTNADVAQMIALLRDRGVSASQDGGNPLTDSAGVELLLSLIHLADHPGDRTCMFHVAMSPLSAKLPASKERDGTKLASWFRKQVSMRGLGAAVGSVAESLAEHLSWWDQHRLEQLVRSAYQFQRAYAGRLREFEDAVMNQKVALPSEAQVKVMTIHKSKGLEFDAVFLPDLQIDLSDSNAQLIMHGSDPCQPPDGVLRYMNSRLQSMLPKKWQDAFEQNKFRKVSESLCLLYVAMTRAQSALYMTVPQLRKQPLQNFASLLQSTLSNPEAACKPGETLYETGDANWFAAKARSVPAKTTSSKKLSDAPLKPQEPTIALRRDIASAPSRGLRVTAPSYVNENAARLPLAKAFSVSQSKGATYGTVIHGFFEQIKWIEEFECRREELRQVALNSISPEELQGISLEQAIGDFEGMLEMESVRRALSKRRYASPILGHTPDAVEIDNERALSLILDGQLIAGTIDRLAVLLKDGKPYGAEIIDFKTDALGKEPVSIWLEERVEHHRSQLEIYAKVVSKLLRIPLNRIATFLVMLSSDDLVRVSRQPHTPHLEPRTADRSSKVGTDS